MLDILAISASLAVAQPFVMSDDSGLSAAIEQEIPAERDRDDRWLLPSLVDLPEEEDGAQLRLRGRKIRLSVPI